MEILKNNDDFIQWKEDNIFYGDIAEDPKQYPCMVLIRVLDWRAEKEEAVYYYKSTFEDYIKKLTF